MLQIESPRLTGLLRVWNQSPIDYDIEYEKLQQIQLLKQKKRKITKKVNQQEQRLQWSYFADGATDSNQIKSMRALFNGFLKEISKILGEPSSEEVHTAAYLIYDILCSNQDDQKKKEAISNSLTLIPTSTFNQFTSTISTLENWRQSHTKLKRKKNENENRKRERIWRRHRFCNLK